MKEKDKIKISYEPQADVMSWELSRKPIDFAEEAGNMVVHFSKDATPVLVEVLEASKFLSRAKSLIGKRSSGAIKKSVLAAR